MSKQEIIKSLRQEIRRLNRVIDMKIIQGLSYRMESRRHKFLTEQLNRLVPAKIHWLARSMSFASLFLF